MRGIKIYKLNHSMHVAGDDILYLLALFVVIWLSL